MWKTDPNLGLRFRDARTSGQLSFALDSPDFRPLRESLLAYLRDTGPSDVAALRRFALLETIYRKPHASSVIRELRQVGKVSVAPTRVVDGSIVSLT